MTYLHIVYRRPRWSARRSQVEPGSYGVDVNGLTGSFTVTALIVTPITRRRRAIRAAKMELLDDDQEENS